MTALVAALGIAVLLSLQPWAADSLAPEVSVEPGLGIGLGDAVVVAPGQQPAVAAARPAVRGEPRLAVDLTAGGEGAVAPEAGIAPARQVTSARPGRPPGSAPVSPSPSPAPPPAPQPAPESVPVALPAPSSPAPAAVPPAASPVTGDGGGSPGRGTAGMGPIGEGAEAIEIREGDEYALSFSFYVEPTAYRMPGADNLILRFRGESSEAPSFGLQLWDDGSGQRGLWSSGEAMDGERFLASVAEGIWHEVVVCFSASSGGDGFYLLLLDGQPVDARAWISLIEPGSSYALVDTGLFRDEGDAGPADVTFEPTRLSDSLEPALP